MMMMMILTHQFVSSIAKQDLRIADFFKSVNSGSWSLEINPGIAITHARIGCCCCSPPPLILPGWVAFHRITFRLIFFLIGEPTTTCFVVFCFFDKLCFDIHH